MSITTQFTGIKGINTRFFITIKTIFLNLIGRSI